MKKYFTLAGLFFSSLSFQPVYSLELVEGFYISPTLSYEDFGGNILDDGFSLDSEGGYSIGLGYQINPQWGLEFSYTNVESQIPDSNFDVESEYFHLDGLYHLADENNNQWSRYWVGGLGLQSYSSDDYDESDSTLNAGAGLSYRFQPNFYFRTDLRGTLGLSDADAGAIFNLGFAYIFNPQEKAQHETAVEVEVPEVATNIDTDNDGVLDVNDLCPGTTFGAKVDKDGCYEKLDAPKEFTMHVQFDSGSAFFKDESKPQIEELAQFLVKYPETKVVIEGHSDSTGTATGNQILSKKRAQAIKDYLTKEFSIKSERMTALGYGESQPIADNKTAEGRAKNRRVVAKISNE